MFVWRQCVVPRDLHVQAHARVTWRLVAFLAVGGVPLQLLALGAVRLVLRVRPEQLVPVREARRVVPIEIVVVKVVETSAWKTRAFVGADTCLRTMQSAPEYRAAGNS